MQLAGTLLAFVDRYNQTARPFSWKFTASDLHGLIDRISRHEQQTAPQDKPTTGGRMTTPTNFRGHPLKAFHLRRHCGPGHLEFAGDRAFPMG